MASLGYMVNNRVGITMINGRERPLAAGIPDRQFFQLEADAIERGERVAPQLVELLLPPTTQEYIDEMLTYDGDMAEKAA